MYCFDLPQTED